MLKVIITHCLLFIATLCCGQYYIRGDVKDERNQPLQNVKIYMPSTRSVYSSGSSGGFGIPSSNLNDSLVFSADGYETRSFKIKSTTYQEITLKLLNVLVNTQKQKLASLTVGKEGHIFPTAYYNNESYSSLLENDYVPAGKNHTTSFAMRIDKASYSNVRRFITQGDKVPADAVRIDEMLNYFNFNYQEPAGKNIFNIESHLAGCPWNSAHELLYLNLSGRKLNLDNVPPSNLVFLIDVSGSMDLPNRLPLLKEAFLLMVKNLRQKDTVSIVTYGGSVGLWLQPTSGDKKDTITKSIEQLEASGDTPGEAAIRSAYKIAQSNFIKGGNNRIILATDGDFNVGQTSEKELDELVSKEKQSGIYLTCLGVGMGNYKDSKIEVLANKGNGNFAYLDDIREAEKVLVKEFTQTLYAIANDVYVSIIFNPKNVQQYRLIGYDNKRSVLDNKGDQLEGGEIGAVTSNTAIFEIIPVPKDSLATDATTEPIASLQLHYKLPGDTTQLQINFNCGSLLEPFDSLPKSLRLAAAVTMFGLKLKESPYLPDVSWDFIKNIAVNAVDPAEYLQTEFITMMDKCKGMYGDKKKRKKKELNNE